MFNFGLQFDLSQTAHHPSIAIPMLEIRRSRDRLIFNMGIPIPDGLYIEMGPKLIQIECKLTWAVEFIVAKACCILWNGADGLGVSRWGSSSRLFLAIQGLSFMSKKK